MQSLGFIEGSPLWVGAGRALKRGEVLLSLALYAEGR